MAVPWLFRGCYRFEVPVNLQNSIMYAFGSVIATGSYLHSTSGGHVKGHHHKTFFEGYTSLAMLLVLFQVWNGRNGGTGGNKRGTHHGAPRTRTAPSTTHHAPCITVTAH